MRPGEGDDHTAAQDGPERRRAQDVRLMNAHIRGVLGDLFGAQSAAIPVLYGGAVDERNCAELLVQGHPDGLFVGRAAWHVEGFARLIAACASAINNRPQGDLHEERAFPS
jgi:triosephosphate isomerase